MPILIMPSDQPVPPALTCSGDNRDIGMFLVPIGDNSASGTLTYDLSFVDMSPGSACYGNVLQNTQNWATVETVGAGWRFAAATYDHDRAVLTVWEYDNWAVPDNTIIKEYTLNSTTAVTPGQVPFSKSTVTNFLSRRRDMTYDHVDKDKYYVYDLSGQVYSTPAPIVNAAPFVLTPVFNTGTFSQSIPGLAFDALGDFLWVSDATGNPPAGNNGPFTKYRMDPGFEGTPSGVSFPGWPLAALGREGLGVMFNNGDLISWIQTGGNYLHRVDAAGAYVENGVPETTWASAPDGQAWLTKWQLDTGRSASLAKFITIGGWPDTVNPY